MLVGEIQFSGIRVSRPDGSVLLPIKDGKEVPYSHKWYPTDEGEPEDLYRLTPDIALELAEGTFAGKIEDFEWKVVNRSVS